MRYGQTRKRNRYGEGRPHRRVGPVQFVVPEVFLTQMPRIYAKRRSGLKEKGAVRRDGAPSVY